MADVDPLLCPDPSTTAHRWIRSAITDEARYCWKCGVRAEDIETREQAQGPP